MSEWIAYAGIEPWGSEREDVRALYQAQAAILPYQKGGGSLEAKRYFPHLFERIPDQSPEEMIEILKLVTVAHGGEVV